MATGYIVSGRGDLDDLFRARTSAAIANTGFRSNGGVDLAQRFEPRGSTAAIANTNFRNASAVDLAQLFMGINAWTVSLSPQTIQAEELAPNTANAGYLLENSGRIYQNINGANSQIGAWINPLSAAPGAFQCMATQVSGTAVSGTLGVWLALTSSQTWNLTRSVNGSVSAVITVSIREGTGPTLASANITLQATRSIA